MRTTLQVGTTLWEPLPPRVPGFREESRVLESASEKLQTRAEPVQTDLAWDESECGPSTCQGSPPRLPGNRPRGPRPGNSPGGGKRGREGIPGVGMFGRAGRGAGALRGLGQAEGPQTGPLTLPRREGLRLSSRRCKVPGMWSGCAVPRAGIRDEGPQSRTKE